MQRKVASQLKVDIDPLLLQSQNAGVLFDHVISQLHSQKKKEVVVLIDEYDSPILSNWQPGRTELCKSVERLLADFYKQLKANSHLCRFRFVTGISYLAKNSIASGMNDLTDLDLHPDPRYSSLLGFTRDEIKSTYAPEIKAIAEEKQMSEEALLDNLEQWYDGFNWHHLEDPRAQVFNPYSVNAFLQSKTFEPYWFGQPTMLANAITGFGPVTLYDILNGDVPKRYLTPPSLATALERGSSAFLRLFLWERLRAAATNWCRRRRDAFKTQVGK